MIEPLYKVKVHCINCENTFETSRVRPSFKRPYKKDSDFCYYYKETNPDYYVVRVCSYCGFATTDNFSQNLSNDHKKSYLDKIGMKWEQKDYSGERTWAEALQTYQLALLCAQIKGEKSRVIAGLLHHIAWLHRMKDDERQELKFLRFALDAYVQVFENEDQELNNARLMYMMGELNRRLKNYSDAVKWFSRVINDKSIMDSAMIKACRDMWALVREEMRGEQDGDAPITQMNAT